MIEVSTVFNVNNTFLGGVSQRHSSWSESPSFQREQSYIPIRHDNFMVLYDIVGLEMEFANFLFTSQRFITHGLPLIEKIFIIFRGRKKSFRRFKLVQRWGSRIASWNKTNWHGFTLKSSEIFHKVRLKICLFFTITKQTILLGPITALPLGSGISKKPTKNSINHLLAFGEKNYLNKIKSLKNAVII